jgi:hypothetical protein
MAMKKMQENARIGGDPTAKPGLLMNNRAQCVLLMGRDDVVVFSPA